MKQLEATVFPSNEKTIWCHNDEDGYGGAHLYEIRNCLGFKDGQTEYCAWDGEKEWVGTVKQPSQIIRFVQKHDNGDVTPGIQNEQLLIILIDRIKKLNTQFPSRENSLVITKLEEVLHWLQHRVMDRMQRGVMGEHKK